MLPLLGLLLCREFIFLIVSDHEAIVKHTNTTL